MTALLVWLAALFGDCGLFMGRCEPEPPCVKLSAVDWCYPPGGPVVMPPPDGWP